MYLREIYCSFSLKKFLLKLYYPKPECSRGDIGCDIINKKCHVIIHMYKTGKYKYKILNKIQYRFVSYDTIFCILHHTILYHFIQYDIVLYDI